MSHCITIGSSNVKIYSRNVGDVLKAGNHQVILSSEGYNTKSACDNGIQSFRKNSKDIKIFEIKMAKDASQYFNLKSTNGQVIGKSEMYRPTSGMKNGIDSVRKMCRRQLSGIIRNIATIRSL